MRSRMTVFAFCLFLMLSAAMNASGLTVAGGLLRTDVAPGEEINHKITLSIGDDEEPTEAVAGVFGYGLAPTGGRGPVEAEKDDNPYSARGFLKVSPESAIIKPGEPVTFLLEGKVPDDVGSGGRYAVVNIATPPRGEGQVGIALAAVVPIILTISGSEQITMGEITNLTTSETGVSVIFENTGNYHYTASAEAILRDESGNVVAEAEAPLAFTLIIPTASWLFDMVFEAEEELAPGTYTVEVSVVHRDGTVLDTEETTFEV